MSESKQPKEDVMPPAYLGDGVYASFDGYQIWLHLNDHRSQPLIALDSSTMSSLAHYARRIWGENK
jgi:hypothetical protein